MAVGDRTVVNAAIREIGFPFTDEIKLLGVTIDHALNCLETIHNKTVEKIKGVIGFWQRFRLSLPGRLGIAKTLCLSQINYVGCFISPSQDQLREMKNAINKFVLGSLNISNERLTLPVKMGGLGFPEISDFIVAQQTVWFKRVNISTRDNWRVDLATIGEGNVLSLSINNIDRRRHPILYNITESFTKFLTEFNLTNDNYKNSFLLNYPVIRRSRRDNGKLSVQAFYQVPLIPTNILARIKFSDVFSGNNMKMLWEINRDCEINLNLLTYMRVGAACTNHVNSLPRNRISDGSALSLGNFFNSFKKGSKSIRRILMRRNLYKCSVEKRNHVRAFYRVVQ